MYKKGKKERKRKKERRGKRETTIRSYQQIAY